MEKKELIESLNWRYAVKRFDPAKVISDSDFEALEETLRLAPSSYGLQPWRFVVIKSKEVREQLKSVSFHQPQVTDASHYVVMTVKDRLRLEDVDHYINFVAGERNIDPSVLSGFRKSIVGDMIEGPRAAMVNYWATHQIYIAMGFVMEAAALLRIDSCPLEGLIPAEYDRILGLQGTGYRTAAAMAFGYRSAECKMQTAKKIRFPKDHVITYV